MQQPINPNWRYITYDVKGKTKHVCYAHDAGFDEGLVAFLHRLNGWNAQQPDRWHYWLESE